MAPFTETVTDDPPLERVIALAGTARTLARVRYVTTVDALAPA